MKRLDEIEARTNAATGGPWEAVPEGRWRDGTPYYSVIEPGMYDVAADCLTPDAEFIAHARQDVPALVAALRGVIELHRVIRVGGAGGNIYEVCQTCNQPAPCAFIATIRQHLGEEA